MASKHSELDAFALWLRDRGLSPGTVGIYVSDLRLAGRPLIPGLLARLRDPELAPKTKRHILAAGRRWAEHTDDATLTRRLKELRLPPPRRQAPRVPITKVELFAVIDELAEAEYLTKPMRAVLGMMACRGFRVGDVLGIHKHELAAARKQGILSYEAKGRRRLEFKLLKTYRKWLVMLADAPGKWDLVDELIVPDSAPECRRQSAAKAVRRALAGVGVKLGVYNLHPHRLRRTYAVEYLRTMKGDPEAIMRLTQHMAWSSIAVAAEYIDHARGDELDTFAEQIFERE